MQLVDIGLNLTHKRFDKDREAVLDRARKARVTQMILTGTNESSSKLAANYSARYALDPARKHVMFSTAGVHPHDAEGVSDNFIENLKTLAERPEVVAIGECGLDFNRDFSTREAQISVFKQQLLLAEELQMPLFLHSREAHTVFMEQLKSIANLPPAIVHCFTGTHEELTDYLEAGYFIGVTGWICDERRGTELQKLVKHIPLERIMLETDAPYLTPRDIAKDADPRPKGGRNEPCFLPHILEAVAKHMGVEANVLAEASTRNAQHFFQLPERKTR